MRVSDRVRRAFAARRASLCVSLCARAFWDALDLQTERSDKKKRRRLSVFGRKHVEKPKRNAVGKILLHVRQ